MSPEHEEALLRASDAGQRLALAWLAWWQSIDALCAATRADRAEADRGGTT